MPSLNRAQKEAVEYNGGPLLIVAGAGTGKTTVIAEKISYLVNSGLAKPEEILALTFTEKAAEEMLTRVDGLLNLGYAQMQISTFHAFCQQLLETHGLEIGLPNQFKLVTDTDAWLILEKHLYELGLAHYRPLGNPTRHIHELLRHFSKCKDELISPAQYLEYAESVALDHDDADGLERSRLTELANAYHRYNQLLLDAAALDFGDLIAYSLQLLTNRPLILEGVRRQYRYILVDEFQDVNWAQYALVSLLAPPSGEAHTRTQLTVVGDDDQAIYAFRGASVANILRFKEDYSSAKEIVLTENYRSGQAILDLAYRSIQQNNPDRLEKRLNLDKRLKSSVPSQPSGITHFHLPTLDDEVHSVVAEIVRLQREDTNLVWDDVAILVRANSHVEPFARALELARIPYEFLAATGLYRQPIVLDCLNFFIAITDSHESMALYRLWHTPCFSFAEADIHILTYQAKKKSIGYYEALKRAAEFRLSAAGLKSVDLFLTLIHEGMRQARSEKPTAVLYNFLEASGYLAYLTHEEEAGNRAAMRGIYHLKQFFDFLARFEEMVPGATVKQCVEHILSITEAGNEGKLYTPTDTPDSVNILTIHAAKGLEFRHVFVVNLVEDRFPTRRRGEGIELPDALTKEKLPEGDAHIEEERRLFYVAITRAKERLYFTSADDYGGMRKKKISRFLAELNFQPESNKIKNQKNSFPLLVGEGGGEVSKGEIVYDFPKVFSFSQVKAYETCPYQYKLAHILKLPTKGSASFSFGQTIHSTMQKFYERVKTLNNATQTSLFEATSAPRKLGEIKVPTLEELLLLYEASWQSDWYANARQREDYFKKGKEILTLFYTAEAGHWTIPVALESWFKIKIGDYLLHGRMDRIDQLADGSLEIIDYKTGKSKETVTSDDKAQLLIYQIAAAQLPEYSHLGKPSKLTFYYLNDNLRTSFLGDDKELQALQSKLVATIGSIHAGNFTATPSAFVCGYCDFRDICEYRVA